MTKKERGRIRRRFSNLFRRKRKSHDQTKQRKGRKGREKQFDLPEVKTLESTSDDDSGSKHETKRPEIAIKHYDFRGNTEESSSSDDIGSKPGNLSSIEESSASSDHFSPRPAAAVHRSSRLKGIFTLRRKKHNYSLSATKRLSVSHPGVLYRPGYQSSTEEGFASSGDNSPRPSAEPRKEEKKRYRYSWPTWFQSIFHKNTKKTLEKNTSIGTTEFPGEAKTKKDKSLEENEEDKILEENEEDKRLEENEDDKTFEENGDDEIFEEKFLDPHYSIRDDVHKKLKKFQWLCGEYGVTGSNHVIPRTHLYVTVKEEAEKSQVFDDLQTAFECEATDYFELRPQPKKSVKIKLLCRPTLGGCVLAVNREIESNPPGDNKGVMSTGTLTMFGVKNGCHHALTCFHVGCVTDEDPQKKEITIPEFKAMRNSIVKREEYAAKKLKYCYRANQNENTDRHTDLGEFCKGSFDSETDIMSIEVLQDVEINCTVAKIESPSWQEIWRELHRRVVIKNDHVSVRKVGCSSNKVEGYIKVLNCSCVYDDEDDVNMFHNVIKVKCDSDQGEFLTPGESGVLVSFLDDNNKEQVFAYGVGEIDHDDENGSFFLCLKLDTALKKLNIDLSNGCFRICSTETYQ